MKKLLTGSIHFYQKNISPRTAPSCRYHPTCSNYALQAIEKHGAAKGSIMGLARVLRCNPFVEGGVDEVPDYFTLRRNPDNKNDYFIPGNMKIGLDEETKQEIKALLPVYESELTISESLPSPLHVLNEIAEVKELNSEEIQTELFEDELAYLQDIHIIPELPSDTYLYFTLKEVGKNEEYFKGVEPFAEGLDIGQDFPLIVLEKTGLWYTNLPILGQKFLIQRGVTQEDIENHSYHLWLVLKALEKEAEMN